MSNIYTQEQIDFVQMVAPGKYNDEIKDLFNARFHTLFTVSQIKSLKSNHGIRSNVPKRSTEGDYGLFTKEQIAFIETHVKGASNQHLADSVNATFGLSITAKQMNTWKKNHGHTSGLDARFKKGSTPPNKGTKGLYNVGGNKTSFKKGIVPHNYMPVGSERVNSDGYVDIKVADPNKWRAKHILIWEAHHGHAVPKGHVVIFGDRNPRNFEPGNLILVSHAQLAVLNRKKLIQNDTDLTRSSVVLADIYLKISQRKKS